ncbi:unnamed protein product, partial [Closterium sp. NIES-64]
RCLPSPDLQVEVILQDHDAPLPAPSPLARAASGGHSAGPRPPPAITHSRIVPLSSPPPHTPSPSPSAVSPRPGCKWRSFCWTTTPPCNNPLTHRPPLFPTSPHPVPFPQRRLPSPGLQVEVILLDHDAPLPQPKKKTPATAAAAAAGTTSSAAGSSAAARSAAAEGRRIRCQGERLLPRSLLPSFMMGATAKPQATPQQQQQKARQQAPASSSAPAGSRTAAAGGHWGPKHSLEGSSGTGKSRKAEEEEDMHPDIFSDSDDDYDERGRRRRKRWGLGVEQVEQGGWGRRGGKLLR